MKRPVYRISESDWFALCVLLAVMCLVVWLMGQV